MHAGVWKSSLLGSYHWLTLPYRRWALSRLRRQGRAPVVVLFYHRVADVDPVPWSIGNRQFARQIEWLQQRFDMVSLEEAQRRLRDGSTRPAAHITFDDGYAENCDFAIPLLLDRQIPCTYFVSLEHVSHQIPFAHDVKLGKRFPINTIMELRRMADAGIEIGAHTRTHPDLGSLNSREALYDEIARSGAELQQLLGRDVRYFAFPFGLKPNIPREGYRIAREFGYRAVMSAYGGYNFPGDDPFHIQRVHGDPEMPRFKNAIHLDPRKMRIPRLEREWSSDGMQEDELAADGASEQTRDPMPQVPTPAVDNCDTIASCPEAATTEP